MTHSDSVSIEFPPGCVIRSRSICFDLFLREKQKELVKEGNLTLLTNILHLTQFKNVPFMNKVRIRLPVDERAHELLSADMPLEFDDRCGRRATLSPDWSHVVVESFSFSPIAVLYDDVKKK